MNKSILYSTLFYVFIAIVVISCQVDDIEINKYDIVQINEELDLSSIDDCFYFDLNSDGENDIGICKYLSTSAGGAYFGKNYLEIINPSLLIATTETTDSIYRCVYETSTYDCSYSTMNESHINCPDESEFSVTALDDQGYPTIIDTISQISDSHTYTNTVSLFHSFNLSNAFGCFVSNYKREYWINTNEKFLIFKITKDGKVKNGYIKLSFSLYKKIMIQKKIKQLFMKLD